MLKLIRMIPTLFVFLSLSAVASLAQTSTSRITGRVIDSKDAVVAGATVTVMNEATGVSQTQTTTDTGLYAFGSLPVGSYTGTVEQSGFK